MDLIDFEAGELYFDEPIDAEASEAIARAAERYGDGEAEFDLLRGYFLEPEHPLVLVALYRFFYYQHRLEDALRVARRVLQISAGRLGIPADWRELTPAICEGLGADAMVRLRFHLLALKGAGFLELRLGRHANALAKLEKLAELDDNDRLGVEALIEVAREAQA